MTPSFDEEKQQRFVFWIKCYPAWEKHRCYAASARDAQSFGDVIPVS